MSSPIFNLDALIAAGEDSRHQFKRDIAHVSLLMLTNWLQSWWLLPIRRAANS